MITVKQQEKLIDRIKSLSELELSAFMEDFAEHIQKNNLIHVVENRFKIPDYEEDIDELNEEMKELERERDELKDTVNKIRNIV